MSQRLATVYDGLSNTLMLAENVNAGISGTWSNPSPLNCTFIYPIESSAVNRTNFSDPPLPSVYSGMPNDNLHGGEGIPTPSSNHPGVVNFMLADGSTRTISENIDRVVYIRLVTPAGTKRRWPGFIPEEPLSGADF